MPIAHDPPASHGSIDLAAELDVEGVSHPAVIHRFSQFGAFMRCDPAQITGANVALAIAVEGEPKIVADCTIAYRIGIEEADKLGTVAGLGLRFCDPFGRDAERFSSAVAELLAGHPVVAKPTQRIRDTVLTAVLAAGSISSHQQRPVFAGSLAELGVPTLLSLLETTHKTGRLVLVRGLMTVVLEFSEGQIVGVRSTVADDSPSTILRIVTSWSEGSFELASTAPLPRARAKRLSVTQLLLTQALQEDEAARGRHEGVDLISGEVE